MAQSESAGLNNIGSEPAGKGGSDLKFAVVVAAGSGTRAGGGIPKQFQTVGGLPMICHSILSFFKADPETIVILVLSRDGMNIWSNIIDDLPSGLGLKDNRRIFIAEGGAERTDSVSNSLALIRKIRNDRKDNRDYMVAVHDAARPMVSEALIREGWNAAAEKRAVIPVVPLADSIRHLDGNYPGGSVSVDRSEYFAVQTPQVFDGALLDKAYTDRDPKGIYTDDASVVEAIHPVTMFAGDPENIKVTRPHDFIVAEALLKNRSNT